MYLFLSEVISGGCSYLRDPVEVENYDNFKIFDFGRKQQITNLSILVLLINQQWSQSYLLIILFLHMYLNTPICSTDKNYKFLIHPICLFSQLYDLSSPRPRLSIQQFFIYFPPDLKFLHFSFCVEISLSNSIKTLKVKPTAQQASFDVTNFTFIWPLKQKYMDKSWFGYWGCNDAWTF